jgi:hypothetical protein
VPIAQVRDHQAAPAFRRRLGGDISKAPDVLQSRNQDCGREANVEKAVLLPSASPKAAAQPL